MACLFPKGPPLRRSLICHSLQLLRTLLSGTYQPYLRNSLLNYFDDFGALVPEPLGAMDLWVVENTILTLGAPMKNTKSLVGTQHTCLGILGSFPAPPEGPYTEHRTSSGQDREMVADYPRSRRKRPDYIQTLRKTDWLTFLLLNLSFRPLRPHLTNTTTRKTKGKTVLRNPLRQGDRHPPVLGKVFQFARASDSRN